MSIRRSRWSQWERHCSESCRTELQDSKGREFEYELFGLGEDKGGERSMYWLLKLNCWVKQSTSSRALDRLASFVLFINTRAWALFLINSYAHVPDTDQDPQVQPLLFPYYFLPPDLLRQVEWFICQPLLQTHFLSLVRHDSGSICGWLMNLCLSLTSKHLHLDIRATYRLKRGGDGPQRISSRGNPAAIAARCWGFNLDKMSSTTAFRGA